MRNREIGVYLLVSGLLCVVGAVCGFLISVAAGLLCLVLGCVLCGWGLLFTCWRYNEIKKMSAALNRATAEGQVLEVRSNREGELSILQNDLYKITSALAGQADHLRQDKIFLANSLSDISHQLKTPLTSLLLLSDLLQNENLAPEKRRDFLGRISSQLERLRWLVSSLLRLSRVDAAVVDFRRDRVALHKLLSKTAEPLLALAEDKGVALSVDCPRGLYWVGDFEWTQEALGNLIKNCVEHAPCGGEVSVCCVENPLHTQMVIQDNGSGFSPADLPHLFERFYRGSNALGSEGVGIGLAMAKTVMCAQQAELAAENWSGGARFTVKLFNP